MRGARSGSAVAAARLGAAVVVAFLIAVIVRLPWRGDLGIHAATVERLRHDLLHPGDPLVDADAASPYYSPWTVFLGAVARLTGAGTFGVLRGAALVGLAALVTGVWRFTRTLSDHRAAPPLALLALLLLWGPALFSWSGFLGLDSLALTVAYPSTFALGLAFHLWAWLRGSLRDGAGWGRWLGLGGLWAVILLVHQFTGVVASLGIVALGASAVVPRSAAGRLRIRRGWSRSSPRPFGALLLGLVLLAVWPYYSFFALLGAGGGLEDIHRALYRDLPGRYAFVLLGVAALALRFRRDRRDPLVLFFVLGAAVVAAGLCTGHYSWGRALPAALVPAQLAAALEAVEGGFGRARAAFAALLALALAAGAWTQAGALGYVLPRSALPPPVAAKYREPWPGYRWITPWVRYGDVVMAKTFPARQIPAYGAYTVAPGYPDFFLPDEAAREAAVRRYFAPGTPRAARLEVLRRYGVRWVVARPGDGGPRPGDPALREVARGLRGQVLYEARVSAPRS
ncbi:hypothetical protein [Streptomyces sp. NRRL B-1347]|uniref:hypothetical protein n=1 Tax=Streptomyces sp. NRRL B-1347 TaxID=1476877 RepID=UPI0004CC3273